MPSAPLTQQYRTALLEDCLRFWFPRCIDAEHGGFFSALDRDGSILDTDKSVWAQGRMSWMLLTLYNTVEKRPEWLEWASSGLRFLETHCYDEDGRMFFHVTREGQAVRKRRYAFSESFAAMAHAAYAKATGNSESAEKARGLFDLFTQCNFTPGAAPAKFIYQRAPLNMGPRMVALVTAQELAANIGDDDQLRAWRERCLLEMREFFVKDDVRCVMENVGPKGEIVDHFDGRLLNPGHAIEASWFVMHEGRLRGDDEMMGLGLRMLDYMWERGWDQEFGGLYYFRDLYGRPVQEYWHDMKFWWPHNEAIIATLLAARITGQRKYSDWHRQVHDWSFARFPDPEHGEWYGYLHRDGGVSVPLKGNLWKSFFHLPRSLWYCWKLLGP